MANNLLTSYLDVLIIKQISTWKVIR